MTGLPVTTDAIDNSGALDFLTDVVKGLSSKPKTLPCKYFYDAEGSRLFDQITEQEAYYPTRSELSILERHMEEMVGALGPRVAMVELGSGSSLKTRLLLRAMKQPAAYIPVDISRDHLLATAAELQHEFSPIPVQPVVADYTQPFELPPLVQPAERVFLYYPGSTIGNFKPQDAVAFLERLRPLVGKKGGLLLGVDRKKDKSILEMAYNDPAGVTEAFHLNLLHRINAELGGEFVVTQFEHWAFYNEQQGRIEMHLRSKQDQLVRMGEHRFSFAAGETICTEYSYKYSVEEFTEVGQQAGFSLQQVWSDERQFFSMYLFTV